MRLPETKGAPTASIGLHTESWSSLGRSPRDLDDAQTTHNTPHRCPPRRDLNASLRVWISDRASPGDLDADAFVCVTNERLEPVDPTSRAVFDDAGPFRARPRLPGRMSHGEAARPRPTTPRRIILTVGPRYADKYRTAAENAPSRYRGALECAGGRGEDRRLPVVYSDAMIPRAHGAHVAARTPVDFSSVGREIRRRGVMRGRARRGTLRGNGGATRDVRMICATPPRRVAEETLPEDVGNEHAKAETPSATSPSRPSPWARDVRVTSRTKQGSTSPSQSPSASFQGKVDPPIRRGGFDARTRTSPRDWFWGDDLAVPKAVRARSLPPSPREEAARTRVRDANDFCRTRRRISPTGPSGAVCVPGEILSVDAVTIDAATVGRFDVETRTTRVDVRRWRSRPWCPIREGGPSCIFTRGGGGARRMWNSSPTVRRRAGTRRDAEDDVHRASDDDVARGDMVQRGIRGGVGGGVRKAEYAQAGGSRGFVDDDQMVVPEHARAHDRDVVKETRTKGECMRGEVRRTTGTRRAPGGMAS